MDAAFLFSFKKTRYSNFLHIFAQRSWEMNNIVEIQPSTCIRRYLFILVLTLLCLPVLGQTKRAFLVGISNYESKGKDSWSEIHGTNDVELLSQTLKKQGFRISKVCDKAATAEKIRNELTSLITSCKPDDIVYLHFSTHGQPVEDLDGDEADGWDEAIVPYDAKMVYKPNEYEGANHITDDELNGYFNAIRTNIGSNGFLYVVIDACHAGSSYRGEEEEEVITRGTNKGFSASGKMFAPPIDKRGRIKIDNTEGMSNICVLEACRAYQVNSEIKENGVYYGALSYYINEVIQNQPITKDTTWTNEVSQKMNNDTRLVRQNIVIETSL